MTTDLDDSETGHYCRHCGHPTKDKPSLFGISCSVCEMPKTSDEPNQEPDESEGGPSQKR